MYKNYLFALYEPNDCIIYKNDDGDDIIWTGISGCLEQKSKSISEAIIFYFAENEKQIEILKNQYQNIFSHIDFHFYKLDCDEYDFDKLATLFYDKILNFPYDYIKNQYFFLPPRHPFIRTALFYLSITKNFKLYYIIPYPPSSNKYNSEKIIFKTIDFSIYKIISHHNLIQTNDDKIFLLNGIPTKNKIFIDIINEIATAVVHTKGPIVLYGSSGCGKTQIAQRLALLMKEKKYFSGPFVEINCATLNTNLAASQLFGHVKGAFTGAVSNTKGLLASANKGILFLDEIALLDMQCQGMLLRAIENGYYFPLGSDAPISSNFFLICASNISLIEACKKGIFREDLLARISTWEFTLPKLKDRPEDFESNLDYELTTYSNNMFKHIMMHTSAKKRYLDFATSQEAEWRFNFRDFHASVQRMAAHSIDGIITDTIVENEIEYLKFLWDRWQSNDNKPLELCKRFLKPDDYELLDNFELMQLENVLRVCMHCKSVAEAGRQLFNKSRMERKSVNDSHRLRIYLQKYGISWKDIK